MSALIVPGAPSAVDSNKAVLFGGNGRRLYKFRQIEFFASTGSVLFFDNRTGKSERLDPEQAKLRGKSMGAVAKKMASPESRRELENLANDIEKCAEHALAQGSFWDPKVQEYHERHMPSTFHFHGADLLKEG